MVFVVSLKAVARKGLIDLSSPSPKKANAAQPGSLAVGGAASSSAAIAPFDLAARAAVFEEDEYEKAVELENAAAMGEYEATAGDDELGFLHLEDERARSSRFIQAALPVMMR